MKMTGSWRVLRRSVLWLGAVVILMAAIPASGSLLIGEVVTIRQPDGTSIDVRIWGDEFYAVGETLDGYTITRDRESGMLSYAELSDDGTDLVSTGVPAGETPPPDLERHLRIDDESASTKARTSRADFERLAFEGPFAPSQRVGRGPTTGEVVGITLLIDFSDDPGTILPATVDDYCNLPGYGGWGNNGSVRDYFYEVSDGNLEYTNFVPTAYFRAPEPKSYYTDPGAPYGQRARQMIQDALEDLDDSGFDFSQYDADNNGIIDAVNCFYAGGRWNQWGEGLWPHAGWITFCADGVCTQRYQVTDMGDLKLGGRALRVHEGRRRLGGRAAARDAPERAAGPG